MSIARLIKRTIPLALGGALTVAALATTPASAYSSGWWTSQGKGAEGFYDSNSGRVYAGDLKRDGYSAITQVRTVRNDYYVTHVVDKSVNGHGAWKTPSLYRGVNYKIRVCVFKPGHRPTKCSAWHGFQR